MSLMRHLGYRGLALIITGIHWATIGAELAHGAPAIDPDAAILHELIPTHIRVWLWVGTGTAVAICGAINRWQVWGFLIAMLMPIERMVSHAWSWQAYLIPGGPGGSPGAWALTLRWACVVALLLLMARWREGSPGRLALTRQEARDA